MKRMLTAMAALLLLMGLTGCQNEQPAATTGTAPTPVTQAPTTEPTEPMIEPVEEGNLRYYYLEDGTILCTHSLDDEGRILRRVGYLDGQPYRVWEFEYTDDGVLDGVQFLCDVAGTEWTWQYGGNSMVTKVTENGVEDTFYEDGAISAVVSYYCDWAFREDRYQNGVLVYSCTYDTEDRAASETQYENGKPFWQLLRTLNGESEEVETAFCDEQGRIIQRYVWKDGELLFCSSLTYDENGNADESTEYPTDDRALYRYKRYAYGHRQMRIYQADEGLNYQARYDEQDRLIWESYGKPYGVSGEFTSETDYTYNEDGSYTGISVGGTGGRYYSRYDKDGNLLDSYGGQDPGNEENPAKMEEWSSYEYNDYGDRISYRLYFEGELNTDCRYEYRYNENGQWTEMISYVGGDQMGRFFRSYDLQGQLVEETDEYERVRDTYLYDENGTLTEKIQMSEIGGNEFFYGYDEAGRLIWESWYTVSSGL